MKAALVKSNTDCQGTPKGSSATLKHFQIQSVLWGGGERSNCKNKTAKLKKKLKLLKNAAVEQRFPGKLWQKYC